MNTKTEKAQMYRWVCREHGEHGRWLRDPNAAGHYAAQHAERRSPSWSESYGCVPHLVTTDGVDQGPAI